LMPVKESSPLSLLPLCRPDTSTMNLNQQRH